MDSSLPVAAEGSVQKFMNVPHDQRWECLKPTIIQIYMEENEKIARVAERMKDSYDFDAQVPHYRYRFKKWGVKKRTTTEEKNAVISSLGKRRRQDVRSITDVTIDQGGIRKAIDGKQLKRHINQSIRHSEPLTWTPGLFFRYNPLYTALVDNIGGYDRSQASSPNAGPASPDYLMINSLEKSDSASGNHGTISPTKELIQRKVFLDRARLFLGGREYDLMAQIDREERKHIAAWLHDFWIYSFTTMKHWGKGPMVWSLKLVDSMSPSRNPFTYVPKNRIEGNQVSEFLPRLAYIPPLNNPTQLCRWAIHYKPPRYQRDQTPSESLVDKGKRRFDINDDEFTWPEWPVTDPPEDPGAIISQGLHQNLFNSVEPEEIPLDADSVSDIIEKRPDEFRAEIFGIAIMSRNLDAINSIIYNYEGNFPAWFSNVFPFHLAARFLDGAKTCCLVLQMLLDNLGNEMSLRANYVDNNGHTVLDTLFVTILRSHSTVPLRVISDSFIDKSNDLGQGVDPCGRWDADSPCIRQLYASGQSTIPPQWKHVFCHTSVQAVCHFISIMFARPYHPFINTPSGLFLRRCGHCGLKLQVGPLHALILTAYHLAEDGIPGESLFGMVSCLVCLLTFRADPRVAVQVPMSAWVGYDTSEDCQHKYMNAAELALEIFSHKGGTWSHKIRTGWKCLETDISDFKNIQTCDFGTHMYKGSSRENLVYCGNRQLGMIWAAIQAEILTYRRLSENDPWLSARFDMELLLKGLEENDDRYLKLLLGTGKDPQDDLLKPFSRCGLFLEAANPGCPLREEVCRSYYANLDDWKRTTFIKRCFGSFDG
ncbi:uncharacterized protein GGS22DRAFT_197525 [Annulohypoxylon maeteangense]|uniref:uncharacterized protein n=1 Tax=Annulohypoxylon maeteangense TaxID=1927788 RepID=UPI0020072DA3|nr:uncharacterized protein GGS22DRAFT_197525 [Annulohypoxylon maeteangense]KAI0880457.1 hypothetical protein GGS22DRAFT_197525 [Annulohypoxylon maeteangense]